MTNRPKLWPSVLSTIGFPAVLLTCTLGIMSDPELVRDMIICDQQYGSDESRQAIEIVANATVIGLNSRAAAVINSLLIMWIGLRSLVLFDLIVLIMIVVLADKSLPMTSILLILTKSTWILVCGEIVNTLMRYATRRLYGIPAIAFFLRPLDIHNPWHLVAISANVFVIGYIWIIARDLSRLGQLTEKLLFAVGGMCYCILVLIFANEITSFALLP